MTFKQKVNGNKERENGRKEKKKKHDGTSRKVILYLLQKICFKYICTLLQIAILTLLQQHNKMFITQIQFAYIKQLKRVIQFSEVIKRHRHCYTIISPTYTVTSLYGHVPYLHFQRGYCISINEYVFATLALFELQVPEFVEYINSILQMCLTFI